MSSKTMYVRSVFCWTASFHVLVSEVAAFPSITRNRVWAICRPLDSPRWTTIFFGHAEEVPARPFASGKNAEPRETAYRRAARSPRVRLRRVERPRHRPGGWRAPRLIYEPFRVERSLWARDHGALLRDDQRGSRGNAAKRRVAAPCAAPSLDRGRNRIPQAR